METITTLPEPLTIAGRIAGAREALTAAGFSAEHAAIDAEVLARYVLGWDRARLIVEGGSLPGAEFASGYQEAVNRRLRREPVAMITGHREFWGLDFRVTAATLVPRPETEMIVEEGLRHVAVNVPATVLDIGTGSGCLAVSLAHERPAARVIATDISLPALLVARDNARAHAAADRVRFVCTDLARGVSARADLIVSNPPYVPERAAPALSRDVRQYEPATALFAGDDGLAVIQRLFAEAPAWLAPGGRLIAEFGYGQEDAVRAEATRAGWGVDAVLHDLQGIARTIVLGR